MQWQDAVCGDVGCERVARGDPLRSYGSIDPQLLSALRLLELLSSGKCVCRSPAAAGDCRVAAGDCRVCRVCWSTVISVESAEAEKPFSVHAQDN